ncbi:hypothetical protein [Nitriliruptor alkaliphilus]|uniref:hypothetical protein n=1 Tax=Nitriliruptor alkaliphilus TaxID=427918 RepID=UPI0006979B28|nr:hypothetical protein [Nitriliruptor alkaliphilus]
MANPAADRRTTAGRILLAMAAVAAAGGAVTAIADLSGASLEVSMVAAWRGFGLAVFAGLFALLAWRPTGYPGVLELAIAHKLALTLFALARPEAADAAEVAVADGLLTIALVVVYVLVDARRAWRPADRDGATVRAVG